MKARFDKIDSPPLQGYAPLQTCRKGWTAADLERGERAIREGRVAVVVLAGGQGSRLQAGKIKGCMPLTLVKQKSLFQVLCERVRAASALYGRPLPLAFMTSSSNHNATLAYFRAHRFFDLPSSHLAFFSQEELPLLDENKEPFFSAPDTPATGPNGNGALFKQMCTSGLCARWQREGIEVVQVIPIDNVLALPFLAGQIGAHLNGADDATLLVCEKRTPFEHLGTVVTYKKRLHIVEYSELSQEEKEARDERGAFLYRYLNLALLTFSLPFIEKVGKKTLPLHVARKAAPRLVEGKVERSSKPFAYKYEHFIFDAFLYAKKVEALQVERESFYAPLKNLEGEDSIDTVRKALQKKERALFESVTGCAPERDARFELAQEFYYPTPPFLEKWRGKTLPKEEYIG